VQGQVQDETLAEQMVNAQKIQADILERQRRENQEDRQRQINLAEAQGILEESRTNHILHLILSLLTGGVWIIVWILIALVGSNRTYHARQTIKSGGTRVSRSILGKFFSFITVVLVLLFGMGLITVILAS